MITSPSMGLTDPGPLSPTSTISAMHHLFLTTQMATLWHILQEYPPLRPLAPC
ncbi:hypothetical protein GW17_00009900 [Ensete ventricosum]|nr:hypothetical protein GW17_00009900 [Ensete ventricosum]